MMAIAGSQIVAGGASAPSALQPRPTQRTTADGLQGMEDGHAQTA